MKYLISFFVIIFFGGCYTVLWTPHKDMAIEDDYQTNFVENNFYYDENNSFGRYRNYYEVPWWYSVIPSVSGGSGVFREREKTVDNSRNDGVRPSTGGSTGGLINRPAPSVSQPSGGSTQPNSGDNNSNTRTSNSNSSSSSSGSSSDSQNRDVRNNDSNRNTGGRR